MTYTLWLAQGAIDFVESYAKKNHTVIEVGAGSSTVWFAKNTGRVVSYENDPEWFGKVKDDLFAEGCENVDLVFTDGNVFPITCDCDILLIDSKGMGDRVEIAEKLYPFVKTGGIMIFDDMEIQDRHERTRLIFGDPDNVYQGVKNKAGRKETAIWIKR